ncbi:hypothetical protein F5884DRAFT_830995 [Xylogone sp. PMI_703]|nr:hypothetical protein F5884DRAFT_830995 [Xylogone sp. PMI_703]
MSPTSRTSSVGADYRDEEHGIIKDLRTTALYSSIEKLLFNEKFSDMIIRCGGRDFKAHRAVVCTQSSFFDKALTGGFQEGSSDVVELREDDPDVVERFLQFLYTGNYEDGEYPTLGKPSVVTMMTPEEVSEDLGVIPGLSDLGSIDNKAIQIPESTEELANFGVPDSGQNEAVDENQPPVTGDATRDQSDIGDSDYEQPPSEGSNAEPPEEYNEFFGYSDRSDTDESEPVPNGPVWEDPVVIANHAKNGPRNMFLSLRLYIMADKYDVPTLKLLARDRFYRTAEITWRDYDDFPDVVDELYTCTPDADLAMREIVCRLVGSSVAEEDDQRARFDAVMRKHGDFAVGVMAYMIHNFR